MPFLSSAPCMPREVEVEVECNSDGAAVVSWNATYGTANFSLTAIVSGDLQTLCATQQNGCNVTGLSCGETYNLSLTASNKQCSLTAPTHANLTTREPSAYSTKKIIQGLTWARFNPHPSTLLLRSLSSSACSCRPAVWLPHRRPVLGGEVGCWTVQSKCHQDIRRGGAEL